MSAGPFNLSPSRIARHFHFDCDRFLRFAATPSAHRAREDIPKPQTDGNPVARAILEGGYVWEDRLLDEHLLDSALIAEGDGIQSLGTSIPPQSPVAWSNFITGLDPGGHGIFDFIHRDPVTRAPAASTVKVGHMDNLMLFGDWKLPMGGDSPSNRTGEAFWVTLMKHGVAADVWRMPINFPVEESKEGVSIPGMMTPAVDSAYGAPSLYSTDPPARAIGDEKIQQITVRGGVAKAELLGPSNAFIEGNPRWW